MVEYAKAGPDDILIRISATNRGPDAAELHLLPTLWFRNTWTWGGHDADAARPMRCGVSRERRDLAADRRRAPEPWPLSSWPATGAPDAAVHRERDQR